MQPSIPRVLHVGGRLTSVVAADFVTAATVTMRGHNGPVTSNRLGKSESRYSLNRLSGLHEINLWCVILIAMNLFAQIMCEIAFEFVAFLKTGQVRVYNDNKCGFCLHLAFI